MKLYADLPGRRLLQVLADLFVIAWLVGWILVGVTVHDAVSELAAPGRALEEAGDTIGERLRSVGADLADVPLIGDDIQGPFDDAGQAAESLSEAGRSQQSSVADLAVLLGTAIAVIPILIWLLLWLPRRVRFARRATAARRFIDGAEDLDLFALRAMALQPMHVLAKVSHDPAGAWRAGDAGVIRDLAALELKASGLRPPRAG